MAADTTHSEQRLNDGRKKLDPLMVFWIFFGTAFVAIGIGSFIILSPQSATGEQQGNRPSVADRSQSPSTALTSKSSFEWASSQLRGRFLATSDMEEVLADLLRDGAEHFSVSERDFATSLKASLADSLNISNAESRQQLTAAPLSLARWSQAVWESAPEPFKPSTPVDLLIFLAASERLSLPLNQVRDLYYDGVLANLRGGKSLDPSLLNDPNLPEPLDVYQWCQAKWTAAESRGSQISEDDRTMYRLAAEHFQITEDQAELLYLEGGNVAHGLPSLIDESPSVVEDRGDAPPQQNSRTYQLRSAANASTSDAAAAAQVFVKRFLTNSESTMFIPPMVVDRKEQNGVVVAGYLQVIGSGRERKFLCVMRQEGNKLRYLDAWYSD